MRKLDVKPGVVYAYQLHGTHPCDGGVVPLVFLSDQRWIGTLRQDARGYGDRAFKRPRMADPKPQAGTVHNDGTVGYPAVCLTSQARPINLVLDQLRSFRLRDFDAATEPRQGGFEFILVTNMKRVIGEWDGQ